MRLIRRRSSRAVTALALIAATTASCGFVSSSNEVILLGDSITVLIGDAVTKAAPDGVDIKLSSDWGLRADQQIAVSRQLAGDEPSQVVINLGTNNVLQHYDVTATTNDLSTILDTFDGATCLHLVTINEHITGMGEDFGPAAAALNEQIRTLAERRLDTDVIDWNQLIADHPGESLLVADGIHPNEAGTNVLAHAYLDAIEQC